MASTAAKVAIIAGVGPGTGAALARKFSSGGYSVALLARKQESLAPVEESIKKSGGHAVSFPTDVSDEESVKSTFKDITQKLPGNVSCAIFNASGGFMMKPFLETPVSALEQALKVSSIGAFIFAQEAIKLIQKGDGKGSLFFTGATASVKGSAKFGAFAPAKFATRALSQSLAREFGPQGIHVAHIIIDGIIDTDRAKQYMGQEYAEGSRLDPDAIADAYLYLHNQDKSCWTQELDLRPSLEKF